MSTQNRSLLNLSWGDKVSLLVPYVRKKILEQVKAVALIVIYLVVFQTLILGVEIAGALVVASGIAVIVVGLALFMEGLFLGLMPLGETLGARLPRKAGKPLLLAFAFILGVGVTFAEPAIGVLQLAGASIRAWDAPLLFDLLNGHSFALKVAVGVGVGIAVVAGMLRFLFDWSLKPYLYIGVPGAMLLSLWAATDPNLGFVNGLAWDCGGVTTGPVTVPLVLALGIGISRAVGQGDSESGGFGVVTLASLFPVVTVILLAVALGPTVPKPQSAADFLSPSQRTQAQAMFGSHEALVGYALTHAKVEDQARLFTGGRPELDDYVALLKTDSALRLRVFGTESLETLNKWAIRQGDPGQRLLVFGSAEAVAQAVRQNSTLAGPTADWGEVSLRNALASLQAILPLVAFLLIVLFLIREKLPRADEVALGVVLAIAGMTLFGVGNELGLSQLGGQVGTNLPSAFQRVEMTDKTVNLPSFDPSVVHKAVGADGKIQEFFYVNQNGGYLAVAYEPKGYDAVTGTYTMVPTRGPLFPANNGLAGILLVLLFAFVMGYGATLAEPALNALGATVETLTVGTFKKGLLMHTVAFGVGMGLAVGVVKLVWDVPLLWLIVPPYILLMGLTFVSTNEFVNIGWDSAGVTTGPITVPLVLALGLGLGAQTGVVEGFGMLAAASAYPILAVLSVGLVVGRRKKNLRKEG